MTSEISRIAERMAAATVAIYMLLTWADAATTNAAWKSPGGELNDELLDRSGHLGLRFWAIHVAIALIIAVLARRGIACMADLVPHLDQRSVRDLFSRRYDEGRESWRILFVITDTLLLKVVAPVSNLLEGAWGFGIPGLVRRWGTLVLGERADVESVIRFPAIYTAAMLAFAFATPCTRMIVRRIARAYPAVMGVPQDR